MSQLSLLPNFVSVEHSRPVNVASVPKRSPFRYPGGKTWLVPLFRCWMRSLEFRPSVLIEPFAGGGIIGLTSAFEKLSDKIVLVELDDQVASVWQTMLGDDAEWLAKRMLSFELTPESAQREFAKIPTTRREKAFQVLLKNRTAHGGILADGAGTIKTGENGKGILSRWYPRTIATRIRNIELVAQRIRFIQGDAFAALTRYGSNETTVFFIDPPYTAGGKRAGSRLYNHSEIDHERLFSACEKIKGDFLLTYDNAEEVRALAKQHGFETKPVAMKNTHHAEMTELLIGKDLYWVEQGGAFHEPNVVYHFNSPKHRNDKRVSRIVKRQSK